MKSHKIYISFVTVKGCGKFPVDMLRYDSCVPDTGEDATAIEMHGFSDVPRTVRLRRYSVLAGWPTVGRWASFGWTVIGATDPNGGVLRGRVD